MYKFFCKNKKSLQKYHENELNGKRNRTLFLPLAKKNFLLPFLQKQCLYFFVPLW